MNRKIFIRNTLLSFASILLPEILRPMDVTGKCVFDEKKINERLEHLRKYPLDYRDCDHNSTWVSIDWPANSRAKEIIQDMVQRIKNHPRPNN